MLTDPENPYEEWSDEVWAETLEEARRKCEFLADSGRTLTEVTSVTQKTRTKSKQGTYRFICWFRTEETQ
jgi:hypothetical protein